MEASSNVTTKGWMMNSGECFLQSETRVDVKFRNGEEKHNHRCDFWSWDFSEGHSYSHDIVAWRLSEKVAIIPAEPLSEAPSSDEPLQKVDKPIVSTGGSSNYYKLSVSNNSGESIECETTDIIYALVGGDFMLGNALKALRRIYQSSKGIGKDGTSMEYDKNKIDYFVTEYVKMCEQTKGT